MACAVVVLLCAAAVGAPRRLPNFVVVVVDDLGWADLGSYGNDFHRTPAIDGLAARGARFTAAYAAAPVCSPTRASLLTGKYPARLQLTDWLPGRRDQPSQMLLRPFLHQQLPLREVTLAEALNTAGYAASHVGKWHLGGQGFGPEEQGFDFNVAGDHTGTPLSYFFPFENRGLKMPGLEDRSNELYLTDRLTTEAERFIERHQGQPFFLHLTHFAVHIPLRAKAELIAKYEARRTPGAVHHNAIYAAMLESVDESVARIIRKLEQLNLADKTLVLFTSDNGGLSVEEGPHTPATSNSPLRDGKGYLYEGGIRVPLIAYWPGVIRSGRVDDTPVASVDVFPTLLELAGVRAAPRVDGQSLAPLFKQSGHPRRAALYWHYPHYSNQGGRPGGAVRQGDFKLIEFYENRRLELYNLKRDPGETRNLATERPRQARALLGKLRRWRQATRAGMMTRNPEYQETLTTH